MIDVCQADADNATDILIDGPVVNGFFIRNRRGDVWDGACWRGFGMPQMFATFKKAIVAVGRARKVWQKEHDAWTARGCTVEA